MRWISALALGVALLPLPAIAAAAPACSAPAAMSDGWTVAPPEKEGLDRKMICAIGPRVGSLQQADPNGVVVVRHGALVYEHHFGSNPLYDALLGNDDNATAVHRLASITKSVVALLTGIAFDRGYLESLDTPVFSFFPEYADLRTPDKQRITLRDLLTMTSGLTWPELSVSYSNPSNIETERLLAAPDPYRFVLQQPLAATPGTVWDYDSGGVDLIGAILREVSRRPLDQFAKEALFDPLGIKDWAWNVLKNGDPFAAGGLWLRPRDLAKIGQLVLNHGSWHGRRIVSAAWLEQMTAPHSPPGWSLASLGADAYGYLWWLGRSSIYDRDIDWIAGIGYAGQRLYVVPSLDLVVVVTAGVRKWSYTQSLAGDTALDMVLGAATKH
jgi:CubicO group peptidase (beta-lactamase class C family)